MDKKMTAILGTALVLIVLFFVYILITKDPTTKVNRESTKNNNQNIVNNNKEVDNIPPVVTNNVQNDVFVPTDLDLSSVTLEEVDEEITTEEILKIYEVNGPNGKVTFKLPLHRTIELSPDKRFVAMDTDYEDRYYAIRLYDVVTNKFYNKILLKTDDDMEKSQGLYWWSPDSKYIAFTKADGMSQDLYIYNVYNDSYKSVETKSLLFCGDNCASEVPFWSSKSGYIGMVEHTRDAGGDYSSTFVTIFDYNGNRQVQSEPIFTGDISTMFMLAWSENNKLTYSYLRYTEDGEELVQDQPVNLDYKKLY